MQAWEASSVGPRELAILAAVAVVATAVAGLAQGSLDHAAETSSRLVVGELKLVDDDEGPADRVQASFAAANLAPGDATVDRLTFIRQPPPRPGPDPVEARLSLEVVGAEGSLGQTILVERLTYGDESLHARAIRACGSPLTVADLAACTGEREGPLSGLPDPTPEGRDLVVGIRLPSEVGNTLQGARTELTVEARLEAWPVSELPQHPSHPQPPQAPPVDPEPFLAIGPSACAPLVLDEGSVEAAADPRGVPPSVPSLEVPVDTLLGSDLAPACRPG